MAKNAQNTTRDRSSGKDALALYYKSIESTRLLTATEERVLIRKFHDTGDPAARDLIIQGALRYVISEARKNPRAYADRAVLEDLIAAGNVGLLRALRKFDPDAGTRFLTYAGWWVRHEMREEKRKIGVVHIPAHAIARGVQVPVSAEIPEHCQAEAPTLDVMHRVNLEQSVARLIELSPLSINEQYVVKACYGIHTEPKTLKQIGRVLKITGERVRQLRETALAKLRTVAAAHRISL